MNIGEEYKNDTERQLVNAIAIAIANNYEDYPFNALINYYLEAGEEKRQHIKEMVADVMRRGMIRRFMLHENYYGIASMAIESRYMDERFDSDYYKAKKKAMEIFRQYFWDFANRFKEAKQDLIDFYKEEDDMFSRSQTEVFIDARYKTKCFKEIEALDDIFKLYFEEECDSYYKIWERGIKKAKEESLNRIEFLIWEHSN